MTQEQNKETPKKKKTRFISNIIGGKIFNSDIFINNIWLLLLIALYAFIYVSNRYAYRQELKHIKELKAQKQDMKYKLLTTQSEFSEKSRQSNIEKYINENESKLKTATNPPFTVK
ncbi:MAG: hypothetical protein IJA04_02835 [Bacteroidaceae bacterium]|nr:hypothetical protein [Bacteroidaceae bacterium]MBQ3189131.1 hypothetical protein [Bacteroidaceae bacterium]MBQ3622625.1 hypothetical protein [Bacteroidaceae bacterium]